MDAGVSEILERVTDGFFALDQQGRFVYVNRAAEELLGQQRARLLGRSVWEVFPSATETHVFRRYQEALRDQTMVHFEETLDALGRCFDIRLHPSAQGVTVYFRDITEAKKTERELRESEARFRLMVEGSEQVFFYEHDTDGRLTYLSPSVREVLGYTPEALRGRHYDFFLTGHPSDATVHEITQREVTQGTRPPSYVGRVRHKQGRTVMLELVEGPVIRDGKVVAIQGFARDVSHRERLEKERERMLQELRTRQMMLRSVLEQMPAGISIAEAPMGGSLYHNQEAERLLGHEVYPGDSYLRYAAYGGYHLDGTKYAPEEYPTVRAVMHGEVVRDEEMRYRRADGTEILLCVNSTPVVDAEGRRVAAVSTFYDISAVRRREADLRRAKEQAEQAMRERDDLLAVISHDLRGPIHAIQLYVSMLLELPLPEERRREALCSMQRVGRQMSRMIQELLDSRRLQAGKALSVERCPTDLVPLLHEACALFRPQAESQGVQLLCRAPCTCPEVPADADRVLQVLWNLIGNALKFTPEGGTVEVGCMVQEGEVRCYVSDSGPGIASEDRQRLFEPYWQAEGSSHLGTGLGLYISKTLVEAHGGRIWVDCESHSGATLCFSLPLA